MTELIARTARLVPYAKRPKQVPSFVTAYSYEPMPDEPGANLGSLFVVLEVIVSGRSSEEVADLIIETIGEHYYNQASETAEPLARFERAVKAVNHELAEYVNQGNAAWVGKLSAVAAIQIGDELHVTQTGSAEAILYRGKAAARIASSTNTGRPATPGKTFGSIASGQLETGDRILLTTPALVHQLSLKKLQAIVGETSPNSAIAEITELLRGGSTDRIASLIIEMTTPELAALHVRSEQPDEIQLGMPETPLEAAKLAAAPIAQVTVTSGRRVGGVAKDAWSGAKPHLQRAGLNLASLIRRALTGPNGRIYLISAAAALVVITSGLWWWSHSNAQAKQLLARYNQGYAAYQTADQTAVAGDAASARTELTKLQTELTNLAKAPGHSGLDANLKHASLPSGEPTSIAGLTKLVSDRLDQLESLNHVNATTLVNFSAYKKANPSHFELYAGKAYLFDDNNDSAIYVVNSATNSIKKSTADTSKLGKVVATALSGANDGIYILTNKPDVWFYAFGTDTLTEEATNIGSWSSAKAIASYATNLYLLGDNVVYKHVRTYTGYSPKSDYLSAPSAAGVASASALAIDGSVWVLSPSGLHEYISGSLSQSAQIPSAIVGATNLRSVDGGNFVIASGDSSQRIAIWNNANKLVFDRQFAITGAKTVYDATYDAKTNTVYALLDGRLATFTP